MKEIVIRLNQLCEENNYNTDNIFEVFVDGKKLENIRRFALDWSKGMKDFDQEVDLYLDRYYYTTETYIPYIGEHVD